MDYKEIENVKMSITENNTRIAKNTIFLYIRMLLIMMVTLYTSRVLLNVLGIEDYGIYNVVGGMVTMFAFFTSSLSNVTQRFFNFELGQGNIEKVRNVFNISVLIYFSISLITLIVVEIIGLWLIYHKLVIPVDRLNAAIWVFQATVFSLFFTLNGIVYNSILIARENMKVYAYIGLAEALSRLMIALILSYLCYDKLKLYAILLLLVTIGIQFCYFFSCKKYPECKYHFFWKKEMFLDLLKFASWNTLGTAVWAINEQGINVLLNIFFGPVVNASKGISSQVNSAVNNFGMNFFTAVRPQIVKSYANKNIPYFLKLVFNSSRYSFFLLLLVSLPLLFRTDYILYFWLGKVPEFASSFVSWIIIYSLINVLTNPLWSAIQAIGRLKKYCLIGSTVYLTAFPISYILLIQGNNPIIVFKVLVFVRLIYLLVVIKIVTYYVSFSFRYYVSLVFVPILRVTILTVLLAGVINSFFPVDFLSLIGLSLIFFLLGALVIYWGGITGAERLFIKEKILRIK